VIRLAVAVCAAGWIALLAPPAVAQQDTVLRTRVVGPITPVTADLVVEAVERAEDEGHAALVVELDTPGGLDSSMREIVQSFLGSRAPVIVYVAPAGARAASAGAIIATAAHVTAMSPSTTIGAATPVDAQTGESATDKVINDAAAYARAVAAQRGRNEDFAEAMVRQGRSVPAEEAVAAGAVDFVAPDLPTVLTQADGMTTTGGTHRVTIHTAGARVVDHELGFFRSLLQTLADPNLAFLFLSIGTLALIYELATPGMGLGGVVGVVMLVLAFFALSVLPVNIAGVLLLVLAAGLFVAEVFTPGIGVFAGGGTIALIFAGLFLFEGPEVRVNPAVLWPTAVVVGGGVIVAGRLAWRARSRQPVSGTEAFAGQQAVLHDASGHSGRAMFDGAWWTVRGARDPLHRGQRVRVVGVDGLTLLVEPVDPEDPANKEGGRS
jgi:membrane-bound serine protease (ClpP class)